MRPPILLRPLRRTGCGAIAATLLPWIAVAAISCSTVLPARAQSAATTPRAASTPAKPASAPARSASAPAKPASAPARRAKPPPAKAAPAPTTPPAPAPFDPAALAQCKNDAGMNFIKRERCVYTHCKGHWGEGDCPPGQDMPGKDSFKNPFKRNPGDLPPPAR